VSQAAPGGLTVLILAGQREGRPDPFASAMGVDFKALVPVAGRPMALHPLAAVASCPAVASIVISINAGSGLENLPDVSALSAGGRLKVVASRQNLVDSVLEAVEHASFPVLITTADNVMLSPDAIAEIDRIARAQRADVAVALARREDVLAAHPQGQRRFYRFADGSYSNCNSYWIRSRSALATAELFRSGGQFVKHPRRVVGVLGISGIFELIRFRFGLGTLEQGCRRLSRRFRLTIVPAVLSDGAVAIDVDHERSLKVAEEVIAARRGGAGASATRLAAC
jgi:GTP:adenosylcobinamide-phosphate guanylyltransferase